MKFFDLTYTLEDEVYERFSEVAERYRKVNGWSEQQVLQFAVTAKGKEDMEEKICFLQSRIDEFEKEQQDEKEEKAYISDEEREKCRKVANAYREELENADLTVLDAGKYGFIKLQYFKPPYGFDDAITFNNSLLLFNDLWEEWLTAQLLAFAKETPMIEFDYEDIFKCLPREKQEELMAKREYFAQKAELKID